MDPITAFSLAAGVLQVIDLSFKTLSKCKEIYSHGSLAENRNTREVTSELGKLWRSSDASVCSFK